MPNWVWNQLTVSGSKEEVQRFVEQAGKPHGGESDLSFWNFVKPEDEKAYEENWYNWNIENWGCKWDASDVYAQEQEPEGTEQYYEFNTPWSPPIEAFREMAFQFPELRLNLVYNEEQGWGGEIDGRYGGIFVMEEWDIPDSHEEYIERQGHCYCLDNNEAIYDDCPKREEQAHSDVLAGA